MVVKGLVCRELYPSPEQRISGDEDLLLDPESFFRCVKLLEQRGMELVSGGEMPEGDAALLDRKTGLYLELHPDRTIKQDVGNGGLERFFERAADRAIPLQCAGITVYTLPHTQHMLYMLLHAFKHFLHSGFWGASALRYGAVRQPIREMHRLGGSCSLLRPMPRAKICRCTFGPGRAVAWVGAGPGRASGTRLTM